MWARGPSPTRPKGAHGEAQSHSRWIPHDHAVLVFDDAAAAIDFYKTAFGATERMRMEAPGGKIGHAEIEIGDSMVMLSDSFPQSTTTSPSALGGTTAGVVLYVEEGGRRRCHRHHGG